MNQTGIEPVTYALEVRCSIQLSYWSILLAVRTGLEPATLGVTGRYSNQLNYRTVCSSFRAVNQNISVWVSG